MKREAQPEWIGNLLLALMLYDKSRNAARAGVVYEEPIVGVFRVIDAERALVPVERVNIRLRRIQENYC